MAHLDDFHDLRHGENCDFPVRFVKLPEATIHN